MGEKAVTLTEIPGAGEELEDYVAALFQASGYYVEKQIVQRDPADLLELDIIATNYGSEPVVRHLIEVKGGKWGYTELFKVLGWMRYLELEHGAFFVTSWEDREAARQRMSPLGLKVVCFDDFKSAPLRFEESEFGKPDPGTLDLWRHSYSVERKLIRVLMARAKSGSEGAREAKSYYNLINNGTFLARAPEESLALLYDAYMSHPKLTLGYAREVDGKGFDPHASEGASESLKAALKGPKYPELHASMYLEHRARIAILKAAVDYAAGNPTGPASLFSADGTFSFRGLTYRSLPASFQAGMNWLRGQPSFRRYATFWQQFLWGWGGFYLEDRSDLEFEWMSKHSGIPADEIPTALEAFDQFFPVPNGWFAKAGATDVCMVRLVPLVFQGIGAHRRREQYELGDRLDGLEPASRYTEDDLAKRINCTVDFLLADIKAL